MLYDLWQVEELYCLSPEETVKKWDYGSQVDQVSDCCRRERFSSDARLRDVLEADVKLCPGFFLRKIHHTMRNSPVLETRFELGKTYVSIGFVDLLQLMVGSFIGEEGADEPLGFIGYDMSEVVVARAMIVHEMLRQAVPAESVLQVWFSSGWSATTKAHFCNSILRERRRNLTPKLEELLRLWATRDLSLEKVLPFIRRRVGARDLRTLHALR